MSALKEQNEAVEKADFEMDTFQSSVQCKENEKSLWEAQVKDSLNVEESLNALTNQDDVQSLGDRDELIGDHKTQMVESHELYLRKDLTGCTKNPGHKEFIPVEIFSLEHLPEDHRDNNLYEYIKATADLTVRVDVRMTSPDRPEFWPDTKASYPFYDMRESTNLRTGSGRVDFVTQFTDGHSKYGLFRPWKNSINCWCKNCQGLSSGSNVWWEFSVYTAAHVVFDDNEASQTSLRLFYDSEDCPVVNIDKASIDFVIVEYDICRLNCVTCDRSLGNKLEKMWKRYVVAWGKVKDKYQKFRDVVKLNFIVSHPHGFIKQVNVGRWRQTYHMGDDKYDLNFTHTNCPGSSGAHVHCVGYDIVWW